MKSDNDLNLLNSGQKGVYRLFEAEGLAKKQSKMKDVEASIKNKFYLTNRLLKWQIEGWKLIFYVQWDSYQQSETTLR